MSDANIAYRTVAELGRTYRSGETGPARYSP